MKPTGGCKKRKNLENGEPLDSFTSPWSSKTEKSLLRKCKRPLKADVADVHVWSSTATDSRIRYSTMIQYSLYTRALVHPYSIYVELT
ncbi:hypothetical protein EVAR_32286_1 [Eumeta japonica]|uniref:Uncharacterized protein n=1 Tax=Eumeta variegata TaxID=151549 RepID=A0A4C1WCZ1_EUMVA|nr:hypothetical protein EVAR_32286_1 [Eumeta japonica]